MRSLAQGLMGEAPRTLALQVGRMLDAPETGLVFQREGFYLFQRHAASTVPRDEAQRRLDADAVTLARQLRETVAHRSRLSRWLVLAVSWDDLL